MTGNTTSVRASKTVQDYISDRPRTPIGYIRQPIFADDRTKAIVIPDSDDEPPTRANNILRCLMSGRNMTTTNNVHKDGFREAQTEESMSHIRKNGDDIRYVSSQKYHSGSMDGIRTNVEGNGRLE